MTEESQSTEQRPSTEQSLTTETRSVRQITLTHAVWEVRGRKGARPQTLPQKGTWCLMPDHLIQQFPEKGMLSCPNCEAVALIPTMQVQSRVELKLDVYFLPNWQCSCGLHGELVLSKWEQRKLYCIVWESAKPGRPIEGHKDYLHAMNDVDARSLFLAGRTRADCLYQIVGVALALGFFVNDKKGEILTV